MVANAVLPGLQMAFIAKVWDVPRCMQACLQQLKVMAFEVAGFAFLCSGIQISCTVSLALVHPALRARLAMMGVVYTLCLVTHFYDIFLQSETPYHVRRAASMHVLLH